MSHSPPYSQEYSCSRNAPLRCDQPQKTLHEYKGAKFCLECGFPVTLPADREIKGRRGTYQIKQCIGARGWGRLYTGLRLGDAQPVVIKEYVLPSRCFNAEDARQRQETFIRIAGLTPADGRVQDFRLIPTLEAIADPREERCYLITPQTKAALPLGHYLANQGAMTATQVREVLNQTLQTLQFLHSQKFRRPSGHVDRGVAHGNLSLESLLWAGDASQFFIYLCDLADWEFLFKPGSSSEVPQPAQDLVALGQIGFDLWTGEPADWTSDRAIDRLNHPYFATTDPHLNHFLLRLMRMEAPFESAEAARQALLQLPTDGQSIQPAHGVEGEEPPRSRSKRLWPILLGILAVLLLGGGIWYAFKPKTATSSTFTDYNELLQDFGAVSGLQFQPNRATYVSQQTSTWTFVLNYPLQGGGLKERLQKPQPNTDVYFDYRSIPSRLDPNNSPATALFQAVENGQAQFAITSLTENLPESLDKVPIAYDGLLVFIPPNDTAQNLPEALHGQISLDDLRRLYTGEITNWSQLGGRDLPVVLRMPTEPEAVRLFEKLVLQDDARAIAQFWQQAQPQPTKETLQEMRDLFDTNQAGVISFSILSKKWDQCGGYPLAIVDDNGRAQQPIVQASGKPIQTTTDLCVKPPPAFDVSAFRARRYPLGYPLVVVYPKDNRRSAAGLKFAELLQTQQGQCLLRDVGLVPLQPVPDDCRP